MTETGPWWKTGWKVWFATPPELPGTGLVLPDPSEPVDWRRGIITLACSLTFLVFGAMLVFAWATSERIGAWAMWLGVVCIVLGAMFGCGLPAGRITLRALARYPLVAAAVLLPMVLYPLLGGWVAFAALAIGGGFWLLRAARWAVTAMRARRGSD